MAQASRTIRYSIPVSIIAGLGYEFAVKRRGGLTLWGNRCAVEVVP
jgi:hypothetical protein